MDKKKTVATPPAGGNGGATVPDTGDATVVYLVLSAVALSATFAAVVISRKRK
jgi:LPXTG-motif cell wall-anchored protein